MQLASIFISSLSYDSGTILVSPSGRQKWALATLYRVWRRLRKEFKGEDFAKQRLKDLAIKRFKSQTEIQRDPKEEWEWDWDRELEWKLETFVRVKSEVGVKVWIEVKSRVLLALKPVNNISQVAVWDCNWTRRRVPYFHRQMVLENWMRLSLVVASKRIL